MQILMYVRCELMMAGPTHMRFASRIAFVPEVKDSCPGCNFLLFLALPAPVAGRGQRKYLKGNQIDFQLAGEMAPVVQLLTGVVDLIDLCGPKHCRSGPRNFQSRMGVFNN